MRPIIHIAGLEVRIGQLVRQRCAWCGELLIDWDLSRMASPEGSPPLKAWDVNGLVEVDGNMKMALPHPADGKLPLNACDKIRSDHEN